MTVLLLAVAVAALAAAGLLVSYRVRRPPPHGRADANRVRASASIPMEPLELQLGGPTRPVALGSWVMGLRDAGELVGSPGPRPLASRLYLPKSVRSRMGDPDDASDLVRALLEAGGHEVSGEGSLLLVGDLVVVVVAAPVGRRLESADLTSAYLRFLDSGAVRGLLVTPGLIDAADVRRRQIVDPLLYAGLDTLERMADAVAWGMDPLLAVRPATENGRWR